MLIFFWLSFFSTNQLKVETRHKMKTKIPSSKEDLVPVIVEKKLKHWDNIQKIVISFTLKQSETRCNRLLWSIDLIYYQIRFILLEIIRLHLVVWRKIQKKWKPNTEAVDINLMQYKYRVCCRSLGFCWNTTFGLVNTNSCNSLYKGIGSLVLYEGPPKKIILPKIVLWLCCFVSIYEISKD